MSLKYTRHETSQAVTGEFRNLDETKQDGIKFATRAPNSKDKGKLWVQYTTGDDTTITFHIRHPETGTWRSVDLT